MGGGGGGCTHLARATAVVQLAEPGRQTGPKADPRVLPPGTKEVPTLDLQIPGHQSYPTQACAPSGFLSQGCPGAMSCVAPGTWAEQAAFKARSTSRDSGWGSAAEERAGSGLAPCFCNADFLVITAITVQGPGPAHRRGHRHQKIGLFSANYSPTRR